MQRRHFIILLGGASVAWPLAARAQQADRVRRIGVLWPFPANDPQSEVRLAAFRQALQQLGWTDGRNLRVDSRWFAGNPDDNHRNALELVALAPDVIFAIGSAAVGPLLQATQNIPIIFAIVPGHGFDASSCPLMTQSGNYGTKYRTSGV